MSSIIPQTSFAAGELSPTLWGQYETAAYKHGLRSCRNFFISQHGAAVSRAGTEYITRFSVPAGADQIRLIPFRYSDDVAYCLAFVDFSTADLTVYVIRDGAVVHSLDGPFHSLDLDQIKYTQSGAVLYLTHSRDTPQALTFGGSDTSWTFEDLDFDGVATSGAGFLALPAPDGTETKEHYWKISTIIEYPSGLRLETVPLTITKQAEFDPYVPADLATNLYDPKPGDGHWAEIRYWHNDGIPADPGYRMLSWKLYRGNGKAFGFLFEKEFDYTNDPESNAMLDVGNDPDFTSSPPMGTNPFKVYATDGTGALVRTEDPTACTFYDGRLVFGGTTERPYTLWTSATDNYLDFDERFVPVPDGSITFTLAARRYEQIRSLVSLEKLLVFTDGGVWAVSGGDGPLAADALIQARVQTEIGASWRDPLVVGGAVLYVADRGGMVHDFAFTAEGGGYAGGDVSFLAQHLFRQDIVNWTHARVPWNQVWAVREDGVMLSLQYQHGGTPGWAQHDTDGTFEDVCAVPEGDEDAVYVVVRRGAYLYVERMASRVIEDVADAICVDCAATYEGAATTTPTGWSHLEGETVYGVADGFAVGPLEVSGGGVTLNAAAEKVTLGLRYVPQLETLDMAQGRNREKNVKRVFVDVEASRALKAGEDEDHLVPWQQRTAGAFTATPLSSETVEVYIKSSWNRGGRVVIRQEDATPLAVTAIAREVE